MQAFTMIISFFSFNNGNRLKMMDDYRGCRQMIEEDERLLK